MFMDRVLIEESQLMQGGLGHGGGWQRLRLKLWCVCCKAPGVGFWNRNSVRDSQLWTTKEVGQMTLLLSTWQISSLVGVGKVSS